MAAAAVAIYLGGFAGLRAAVEAAEVAGPVPLPDFDNVVRRFLYQHSHPPGRLDSDRVRADDARWLLARIGPCDGYWLVYLLEPLAGAPDHPAAWAAAYRHATGGHEALLREAPPGALARLVLLEALPGGADRRALAREVIARLRAEGTGFGRGALELLAARMGPAGEFAPHGGLRRDPAAGPYPADDGGDDTATIAVTVATGGPAGARRALANGYVPAAIVDFFLPLHVGDALAGDRPWPRPDPRDHAGALRWPATRLRSSSTAAGARSRGSACASTSAGAPPWPRRPRPAAGAPAPC